jgi:hypothetical protein
MTTNAIEVPRWRGASRRHPMTLMVSRRVLLGHRHPGLRVDPGVLATEVLPGNAATAVLQSIATLQRLRTLEVQLHLNEPVPAQYWRWDLGFGAGPSGLFAG